MRNIFILATNGFSEVVRHRFFYGLSAVAFLIIGVGALLGPLSMSEEQRITINFSLLATQIVLIMASVFFGSLSITRDIEKKTLTTLITRSMSRAQYILGKFLGIAIVIFVATTLLGGVLTGLFYIFDIPLSSTFFISLWGIYLEAIVLLSISILFSSITSSFLIICYTACFFIVGHWVETLKMLLGQIQESWMQTILNYSLRLIPNLENFNWRAHVVYQDKVPLEEVFFYSCYALFWVILFTFISIKVFNRKDFV